MVGVMAHLDEEAKCVQVDPTSGLVRVDGIPVFRVIAIPGNGLVLQFKDPSRERSKYRGAQLIEIPIDVLFEKLIEGSV